MRQGAGEETLPGAGGPDQDHVVVLLDPAVGGKLADHGLVELAAGRIVDRLDARLGQLELGLLQGAAEPLVLPGEPLGLDEQAQALVEGEGGHVGLVLLVSFVPERQQRLVFGGSSSSTSEQGLYVAYAPITKRAKSSEFTFGDATYHRERVAQLINL
jgi:hypothetical protein